MKFGHRLLIIFGAGVEAIRAASFISPVAMNRFVYKHAEATNNQAAIQNLETQKAFPMTAEQKADFDQPFNWQDALSIATTFIPIPFAGVLGKVAGTVASIATKIIPKAISAAASVIPKAITAATSVLPKLVTTGASTAAKVASSGVSRALGAGVKAMTSAVSKAASSTVKAVSTAVRGATRSISTSSTVKAVSTAVRGATRSISSARSALGRVQANVDRIGARTLGKDGYSAVRYGAKVLQKEATKEAKDQGKSYVNNKLQSKDPNLQLNTGAFRIGTNPRSNSVKAASPPQASSARPTASTARALGTNPRSNSVKAASPPQATTTNAAGLTRRPAAEASASLRATAGGRWSETSR